MLGDKRYILYCLYVNIQRYVMYMEDLHVSSMLRKVFMSVVY